MPSRLCGIQRRNFSVNTDKTMRKNLFALGCAVLMLALPGCVQDPTTEIGGTTADLVEVTVKVSAELPADSRVALGTGEYYNRLVWKAGDVITAVGSDDQKYTYTIPEGDQMNAGYPIETGAYCTFSVPDGVTLNYCYVVGSGTQTNVNSVSATSCRPGSWGMLTWVSSSIEGLVDQLFCVGKIASTTDGMQCVLRNTLAIAEIKLTGSGQRVWGVTLASRDHSLRSNYGYVDLTSDEPVWVGYETHQNETAQSPEGYATWMPEGSAVYLSETPTSFFFAVPVKTSYSNLSTAVDTEFDAGDLAVMVRCSDSTGDYTVRYVSKNGHEFQRNHVTPFAPINVARPSTAGVIDLSGDGASNCYMVKPSTIDQVYSFTAQVPGMSAMSGSYAAFPLWETKEQLIKDIWYCKASKKVYFTVPANCENGSTIIGCGFNNNNAWKTPTTNYNGYSDVRAAWHIWVTDAKDQTYGGITVLDRNVGASYAPASKAEVEAMDGFKAAQTCGFYYQWGSRRPFPGPKTLDGSRSTQWNVENGTIFKGRNDANHAKSNTQDHVVYKYVRSAQAFNFLDIAKDYRSKEAMTAAHHVASPLSMSFGLSATTAYTWATDVLNPCGGSEETWAYEAKGNQDPCPQGYRVATHDELFQLFRQPTGQTTIRYAHYDADNKVTYVASTVNRVIKEYGGYAAPSISGTNEATDGTQKSASYSDQPVGDNFVWVANSGIRTGATNPYNSMTANDLGKLRYAGIPGSGEESTRTGNMPKAVLWGVPKADHTYLNAANFNASKTVIVSWAHKQNSAVTFTDTYKPIAPLIYMDKCGNMYEPQATLALNNAVPVRCVKIAKDTPSSATAAPMLGVDTDNTTWE